MVYLISGVIIVLQSKSSSQNAVQVAVFFLQTFSLISQDYGILTSIANLSNLNLDTDRTRCFAPLTVYSRFFAEVSALPVCYVIGILFGYWAWNRAVHNGWQYTVVDLVYRMSQGRVFDQTLRHWNHQKVRLHRYELKRSFVLLSICLYAPMTRWSLAMFGCRPLREFAEEQRLNVDLGAVCWTGIHYAATVAAILVLSFFGIGLPCFYLWYLRRQRTNLWDPKVVRTDPYAALYAHVYVVDYTRRQQLYTKKTEEEKAKEKEMEEFVMREVDGPYWWFCIEFVKKFLINVMYLGGQGAVEPYRWRFALLICMLTIACLMELVRPFRRDAESKMYALAHALLVFLITAELLNETGASADGTASLPASSVLLLLFVVGGLMVFVLLLVRKMAMESTARVKGKLDGVKRHWGKAAQAKYVVGAMGKKVTEQLTLPGGDKFDSLGTESSKANAKAAMGILMGGKGTPGKSLAAIAPAPSKPKASAFQLRDLSVPQAVNL
jgi:uncharacterized integral membrane protein